MNSPQSPLNNLSGKTAVVLGVADRESIAWAIAELFAQSGAKVTIGYQQRFYSRIHNLLRDHPTISSGRCDIHNPDEMEDFFKDFKTSGVDILVHSIAYGPNSVFTRLPSEVSSGDFADTLEVSTHSLAKIIRFAKPHLNPWASVITLTFQASQQAWPMYGMMGVAKAALESLVRYLSVELGTQKVRVNALSAGPIATLAALSEVVAFRRDPEALKKLRGKMMAEIIEEVTHTYEGDENDDLEFARHCWERIQQEFAERSAIPEVLSAKEVAEAALFFAGDGSRKITGQVLNVDCGFSACQLI